MDIKSLPQFLEWKPPQIAEIISSGILLPESRLILHGKYKSWKSMTAMHTAFCISEGKSWFGFSTTKTPTLIVQIEISEAAFHKRVTKYSQHNQSAPSNMFVATQHYIKFDTSYGMADLDRAIGETGAGVVIIDPLYKVITGDMNAGYEVGKLLDNLDILKAKHKCSYIIIHHERKSQITDSGIVSEGAEEISGSQSIANWCDTAIGLRVIKVFPLSVELELTFTALRNAEEFLRPVHIKVTRHTLTFERIQEVMIMPEEISVLLGEDVAAELEQSMNNKYNE